MSSRAKRRAEKREEGNLPTASESTAAGPPKKEREPAVFTILGLIIFFAGGVFLGMQFFESWSIGLGCGVGAFIVGAVLVWKGESVLDALSGL
jgi:hypothetical protein